MSPNRVHLVPPAAVTHVLATRLPEPLRGRRHGGDWDLEALPVADLVLTRALRQRFVEGLAWDATLLADGLEAPEAPALGTRYVARTREELQHRFAELDRLHTSLTTVGWLAHHDVGATFDRELAVAIGRDGRLARNAGGLHRLILAQLLELPVVPVRVLVEHPALEHVPTVLRGAGDRRGWGRSAHEDR